MLSAEWKFLCAWGSENFFMFLQSLVNLHHKYDIAAFTFLQFQKCCNSEDVDSHLNQI